MISPRTARLVARIHKWLGLIVGAQLAVWTATGLFFTAFALPQVRGEHLLHPPAHSAVDMRRVKLSSTDALKAVVEDAPTEVTLRSLAGIPVYEIRAALGVFLVSAETGEIMSPISEGLARQVATRAWAGKGALASMDLVDKAPREAGLPGQAWAAHFDGPGHPVVWISAINGQLGPARTDLWRTYDFLYGLHLMDYAEHENAHQPWTIGAAILALSTVLFGIVLLLHRFTRGVLRRPADGSGA
ncbi:MAG: hypothetical protein GC155_14200 [Alphaproteobacteria bacterium]|nr:hypothetical protein [Alphaproteobacteria bacterium]